MWWWTGWHCDLVRTWWPTSYFGDKPKLWVGRCLKLFGSLIYYYCYFNLLFLCTGSVYHYLHYWSLTLAGFAYCFCLSILHVPKYRHEECCSIYSIFIYWKRWPAFITPKTVQYLGYTEHNQKWKNSQPKRWALRHQQKKKETEKSQGPISERWRQIKYEQKLTALIYEHPL